MKKWIVRFVSLLVFNVVVLLLIGMLSPARVGWAAIPAAIVMTLLVLFVKPLIEKLFSNLSAGAAAKREQPRGRIAAWFAETIVVLGVALVVWVLTVIFSGVRLGSGLLGILWSYIIPPIILWIGWVIYAAIDDKVEAQTAAIYDRATGGGKKSTATASGQQAPPVPSRAQETGRRELNDGLTDEQRRMLDSL